jgi:hypothetical protein
MYLEERLFLPRNWESVLEQMMIKRPIGHNRERIYICSPCRAETANGVYLNMKAARVYMYYSFLHFSGVPKAPHAYIPVLLNDNYDDERGTALHFGSQLMANCDSMYVCGNHLSEGMYEEITGAINHNIPV